MLIKYKKPTLSWFSSLVLALKKIKKCINHSECPISLSSDLEKMCPNLTQPLGLCWIQNAKEMMSYWLLKIGELGSYAVLVVFILKYIPEILKSLFLFYQKYLDHKLEWRKHEDEKSLKEKEIEKKTYKRRKPPS